MKLGLLRQLLVLAVVVTGLATIPLAPGPRSLALAIVAGCLVTASELAWREIERRRWAFRDPVDPTPLEASPDDALAEPHLRRSSDVVTALSMGLGGGGIAWAIVAVGSAGRVTGWPLLLLGGAGAVVAIVAVANLARPPELSSRPPREPWRHDRRPGRGTRPAPPGARGRRGQSSL